MEEKAVIRDDQIELLANASERKKARAQDWLATPAVKDFIRDFHARTHEMKSPPRTKKHA